MEYEMVQILEPRRSEWSGTLAVLLAVMQVSNGESWCKVSGTRIGTPRPRIAILDTEMKLQQARMLVKTQGADRYVSRKSAKRKDDNREHTSSDSTWKVNISCRSRVSPFSAPMQAGLMQSNNCMHAYVAHNTRGEDSNQRAANTPFHSSSPQRRVCSPRKPSFVLSGCRNPGDARRDGGRW
ncbi:hypothetical protein F4782DRAFT_142048 [Xylaria castorea]|nr:hypothetical protein F4782DRAFT_142048 [Xylaria castorea]